MRSSLSAMWERMSWLNEPGEWSVDGDALHAVTGLKTDFWRETFYGWVTDNGHFFSQPVTGDFTAEVVVAAEHTTLFDQAGMMLRAGERDWLKSGLEVTSGAVQVSTVFTRGFSDVSMAPVAEFGGAVSMRLTRFGEAVAVHCRGGDGPWQLLRLGHLDLPATVDVGVMCCSPERAGLRATFRDFRVGPAISRDGLE
jgi:regulation of enolase protein 1 (concanavalin A-like superfamily)